MGKLTAVKVRSLTEPGRYSDGDDEIIVRDWFEGTRRIEWLRFANGDELRLGDFVTFQRGTGGDDVLIGTPGSDVLLGEDGDDRLMGLGGDDLGSGGLGNDLVHGNDDQDMVLGGAGDDTVLGGGGHDAVFGDGGKDTVFGGLGDDIVVGGRGDDLMVGGAGNDLFRFERGDGRDTLADDYAGGWETVWDAPNGFTNGYTQVGNQIVKNGIVYYDGSRWLGDYEYTEQNGVKRLLRRLPPTTGAQFRNMGSDTLEFGVGIDIQDLVLQAEGSDMLIGITGPGPAAGRFARRPHRSLRVAGKVASPSPSIARTSAASLRKAATPDGGRGLSSRMLRRKRSPLSLWRSALVSGVSVGILLLTNGWPESALATPATVCEECPPMVPVPGIPGAGRGAAKPLYVARHETTWREYLTAVREAGCPAPRLDDKTRADPNDPFLNDDYPVSGVTVVEYQCYLDWLSRRSGRRYRLPTPAEWEHFARAGTKTNYPWGDSLGQNHAVVHGHYDKSLFPPVRPGDPRPSVYSGLVKPVEHLAPNPWGLFDTIGNAAEVTTETKEGTATCLRRQSPDWCRLIAARGQDLTVDKNRLMTERTFRMSGAFNFTFGFRPVSN